MILRLARFLDVMGKCRNAPVKERSVPRLQLQTAVLSSRLHKLILKELEPTITVTFFWSESMTTLQYIKNEKRRFGPFVSNRLNEIHEASLPTQWRHVPGNLNPADDGSRGMKIDAFQPSCRWWTGPCFLWQPEDCWPTQHVGDVPDTDTELQTVKQVMVVAPSPSLDQFLNRCSSRPRLQRQMAWLLRFIKHLKNPRVPSNVPPMINLMELRVSCLKIVHVIQCQYFHKLDLLRNAKQVSTNSKLSTLNPILVDDVIRVGGRIRHAPVSLDETHPMILPKEHPVSTLIIRHNHEIFGHAGREHVLSFVRRGYWILQARALTRKILRHCIDCRKRCEAVMQQFMADLPSAERLVPYEPPFTYTEIDIFGPFLVKRGRSTVKVYGCIFVCFNSRAVHIEDASSLETDVFIQALRIFISNRGCPKKIWSDNGTNFIGAEKELRQTIQGWKKETIQNEMPLREIEWEICSVSKWHFQPPTASHMSGVWERLIRSVRKSMKAIIGHPHAFLSLEVLRTLFAEVATILNSRPIFQAAKTRKIWNHLRQTTCYYNAEV